ncbi:MAG: HAMP domain-containing sensor histidine kinase [Elusimicrobiales bacterium]|nr:HAMP domain-containing sensor histidine kinase [Elusimicrobiales bacterium]
MAWLLKALERGEVTSFSRNSYELVFSVFMIGLAYLYRDNPVIAYPRILYFFLLLLSSNFVFSWLLRRRASVSLWLLDLILAVNFLIITGVLHSSGGGASYFWVLYLLPVFGASLMARLKDAAGMTALCAIALCALSWPITSGDLAGLLALSVKLAVLAFSAGVVYNTSQSQKRAEAGLAFKREQVGLLEQKVTEKETQIVQTASAGEVGTLVSGVMHDLGNSVSVILLSAEIASQEDPPDKANIARILKAARFSKGMISNAMSIVRGQEYVFEQVSLAEAVENAALLTEYSVRKKNIKLELDVPLSLPDIRASKVHVERIFINAIMNSASFVPERGTIRVAARRDENGLLAEVSDNGPGFPEKLLQGGIKAFATTRKETGGTGLGLYVCSQIARRHDGSINLSNLPGGGALVKIFLPYSGPV